MPPSSDDWAFISYDPTADEPPAPSLIRRGVQAAKTIALTAAARTLALAAVLVIARHALLMCGGQ